VAAAPFSGLCMQQLLVLPVLLHATSAAVNLDRIAALLNIHNELDKLDLMAALDPLA
jgi:hypothetical protein